MNFEFKRTEIEHFDCNIVFYGQEDTSPGYTFGGNNIRDCYILHYITAGKGTFASAGKKMATLQAGDVFLLPKSVPCFYQADKNDPWSYFWIGFSGVYTGEIFARSALDEHYYLRHVNDCAFGKSFKALFEALRLQNSLTNSLLTESLLYQTFHQLLAQYPNYKHQKKLNYTVSFKQATDYFKRNYQNGCNVSDACANLHISRSYLHSLFKQNLNISPQQYLLKLKLTHAKKLLTQTDYSLQQIANLVGYKDQFTFSKAFKRCFNQSPLEYRNQINFKK